MYNNAANSLFAIAKSKGYNPSVNALYNSFPGPEDYFIRRSTNTGTTQDPVSLKIKFEM